MRIIGAILWLLVTGYLVSLCFHGMNLPRDDSYIGGIIVLCIWFFMVTPFLSGLLYKYEKKKVDITQKEKKDETNDSVNSKSTKSDGSTGMYD